MNAYTFNRGFQTHVLAVLLRHESILLRYRNCLSPTYFTYDVLTTVAEVLFAFVEQHRKLPTRVTFTQYLTDAQTGLSEEDQLRILKRLYAEDITDADTLVDKLVGFGSKHALVEAVQHIAEDIAAGKEDIEAERIIREALAVGQDVQDLGQAYKDSGRLKYYTDDDCQVERIPTGIYHLDIALTGGLARGELGVIFGPPKRGKSTCLINLGFGALCAAAGYNVVHYTLEMSREQVLERYDDRLMGETTKIKHLKPVRYKRLVREALSALSGQMYAKRYNTRKASVDTFRAHLDTLSANGFVPDVIIVDYADIVKPPRKTNEKRFEQAEIYEDLRALAGERNAAVWTGSQANRASLDKSVLTIADLAEAFEKAAIADALLAFCQTSKERKQRQARLFAAATRFAEDYITVLCQIDRGQCLLTSTGLFDAGNEVILTERDDPDTTPKRLVIPGADNDAPLRRPPRKQT